MSYPPDRFGDNRWNECQDALIEAWNRHGPDKTRDWVKALAKAPVTAEGVAVVELAAGEKVFRPDGSLVPTGDGGDGDAARDGEVA